MSFSAGQPPIWPVTPNWSAGVRETLAWSTEIQWANATGVSQHISERLGPRRGFTFDVLHAGQERRLADMLLSDRGGRPWLLPIWPDVQWLADDHPAGSAFLACRTAGFDFAVGSLALLYRSAKQWEVVGIDSIEPGGLGLTAVLASSWASGVRLFPLRRARTDAGVQMRTITDTVARAQLAFRIDEPCDWPAALPETQYLGRPVFELVSDAGEDGVVAYEHDAEVQDDGAGLPASYDIAGVVLRSTPHAWELWGREEHGAFRSLLYGLRGRQVPVWVPSSMADLQLSASMGAASTLMSVEWCGYHLYGRAKPNRRDIRIELHDGTAIHRRIVGSADTGETEVLELSAPLGQAISPAAISRISFMTLSTLASDEVSIQHYTDADGRARAVAPWKAVVPDA